MIVFLSLPEKRTTTLNLVISTLVNQKNHHTWLTGDLGYPVSERTSQLGHKVNSRDDPFSPWEGDFVSSKFS